MHRWHRLCSRLCDLTENASGRQAPNHWVAAPVCFARIWNGKISQIDIGEKMKATCFVPFASGQTWCWWVFAALWLLKSGSQNKRLSCCSHFQWLLRKNARKAQPKGNFTCPTGMSVLAGEWINRVELVSTNIDLHGRGLPAPMNEFLVFKAPISWLKIETGI